MSKLLQIGPVTNLFFMEHIIIREGKGYYGDTSSNRCESSSIVRRICKLACKIYITEVMSSFCHLTKRHLMDLVSGTQEWF